MWVASIDSHPSDGSNNFIETRPTFSSDIGTLTVAADKMHDYFHMLGSPALSVWMTTLAPRARRLLVIHSGANAQVFFFICREQFRWPKGSAFRLNLLLTVNWQTLMRSVQIVLFIERILANSVYSDWRHALYELSRHEISTESHICIAKCVIRMKSNRLVDKTTD